jgi:hypothetical protein
MKCNRIAFAVVFVAALAATEFRGETFPRFEVEVLSGGKAVLPEAAKGRVALLVAGFSRDSQNVMQPWVDRFVKDFGRDPRLVAYSVAVLEGAPRFIRPLIVGGMRKSVPATDAPRFLLAFHEEKVWKQTFGFAQPDDAYLVLLDSGGNIRWKAHGRLNESDYAALKGQAVALAK